MRSPVPHLRGESLHSRESPASSGPSGNASCLFVRGSACILDATSRDLLKEGWRCFADHGLSGRKIVSAGAETLVFTWMGDRVNETLSAWLKYEGLPASNWGPWVEARPGVSDTLTALGRIAADDIPDPVDQAAPVGCKATQKYDHLLSEPLMNLEYASRQFDVARTREAVKMLL